MVIGTDGQVLYDCQPVPDLDVPAATVTDLLPRLPRPVTEGPWILQFEGKRRFVWESASLSLLRAAAQRRANKSGAVVDDWIFAQRRGWRIHIFPQQDYQSKQVEPKE